MGKKKGNRFLSFLLMWGKPIIKKLLKETLVPLLQKEINAGAVDKQVDEKIAQVINKFIDEYL